MGRELVTRCLSAAGSNFRELVFPFAILFNRLRLESNALVIFRFIVILNLQLRGYVRVVRSAHSK